MSVKLIDNFSYQGKLPNFSRDTFRTLNDMKNFAETNVDEGHISYNLETKKHYKFNSSNPIDTTLGKWRLLDNDISTTLNTKVTDLTNKINGKANSSHTHTKSQITDMPTKLSQFSNDAGYITAADVDTSTSHIHSNKTVLDGITSSSISNWNAKLTPSSNSSITITADSDKSLNTEFVMLKAGYNELKLMSSGGGDTPTKSNTSLTLNGNIVYTVANKPTKSDIGLGNVTNESKATMFTNAALTGIPTAPTAQAGTNTTQIATTEFVTNAVSSGTSTSTTKLKTPRKISLAGSVAGSVSFDGSADVTINTTTNHTHTKANIGLGNVDNTSDANKPISTATQTALNKKWSVYIGNNIDVSDRNSTTIYLIKI